MSTPRSPERAPRVRHWLLAAALACLHGAALAATPGIPGERAYLVQQQQVLADRFDREAAACRERFLVTDCIELVNRQRRVALAPVRERLLQIDEAERQRRADERRAALAAKQKIRDERMAAALAAERAASSASAPIGRQRTAPLATPMVSPAGREGAEAERQRAAAERVKDSQRRQLQAAERQARVARRLAERDAKKGPVQPLPTPAASAAPASSPAAPATPSTSTGR